MTFLTLSTMLRRTRTTRVTKNFLSLSTLTLLAWVALTGQSAYGQLNVVLNSTLASPQPVGQTLFLAAKLLNSSVIARYRFMVQPPGATSFNMLADYSLSSSIPWSSLQEGTYQIQVSAVDPASGQTGQAVISMQFTSRITGTQPVVSPSSHPLVAIYSVPPCNAGQVQVVFRPTAGTNLSYSNVLTCQPGQSLNFYIAGMRPQTSYTMGHRFINNGNVTWGPQLTFTTGAVGPTLATPGIAIPVGAATSTTEDIVLQAFIALSPGAGFVSPPNPPTAYSLNGDVLWYYPTTHAKNTYLVRPVNGGTFLLLAYENAAESTFLEEVDLQGNLVHATNSYTLSQQLTALGLPPVNWLSHEAVRLANGHTLVLGSTERMLTNVQGPGPVDVVGDMILDLDQNWQVTWTWNTFDHLPNSRKALLGEQCANNDAPCGPLYLAPTANDWTHCNSLYLLPDGNLVLSIRSQDWVVKINYKNGAGDGRILWTLGNLSQGAGTKYFTLAGAVGPWPWFSHQHNVEFDGTNFELIDNGNTRVSTTQLGLGYGNSRGQVYNLNETTMVAAQLMSTDLGTYSGGFGSAQLLANGNYWFGLGFLFFNNNPADSSVEVPAGGGSTPPYLLNFASSAYRTFRLSSLYNYTN